MEFGNFSVRRGDREYGIRLGWDEIRLSFPTSYQRRFFVLADVFLERVSDARTYLSPMNLTQLLIPLIVLVDCHGDFSLMRFPHTAPSVSTVRKVFTRSFSGVARVI
jgi:hypothetical protein